MFSGCVWMCSCKWSPYRAYSPPRSLAKHRIGTKRHRVCLEIPQEVSQSELFPKEELSSGQYDLSACPAALAPVRPTHSSVRQVEDGLPFPGELVTGFSPSPDLVLFCVGCHAYCWVPNKKKGRDRPESEEHFGWEHTGHVRNIGEGPRRH